MTVRIKLKGVTKVTNNLRRINQQIVEAVKDTNAKVANRIKGEARRNVPVFTGNLRKTIVIQTVNASPKFTVRVGSKSKYAMKIEFGYSGMKRLPSIKRIREWVAFKGLPESMVMPLALKLKRKGSAAQPYLVPAFDRYAKKYEDILRFRLAGVR